MQPPSPPISNVPEFSVSDLAFSLKRTIEENYGRVRVRGELGRLTFHSSGHMYGNIKDERASIDAVCWRTTLPKLSVRPEEGLEVICTGRLSTYPARSNYQLIIESMEPAGEGALLKLLEERKKKLAAEGLFAAERKKPLPFLPQKIGVITSPTGAVIRDILHRLRDRFPSYVQVWPARVQGDTAAAEVTAAIEEFQKLPDPPDVLIVARGGGSLEDLMPFNEEALVRAIAACTIPIISAVGHETDTTLADFAADLRAPTPTAAAEHAVPVRAQLQAQVMEDAQRLTGAMNRQLEQARLRLEGLRPADPKRVLEMKTQALDHTAQQLGARFDKVLFTKRERLMTVAARLKHPRDVLQQKGQMLDHQTQRLKSVEPNLLRVPQQKLEATARMLESLSFENVLKRGYVVVRDTDQKTPITDPDKIGKGQSLELQYAGDRRIKVTSK